MRIFVVAKRADGATATGSGTGFVIAREYVATNKHVVTDGNAASGPLSVTVTVRETGAIQDRKAELAWSSVSIATSTL